jgi:FlaG/FlaF family flagellin (archaellin)
MNQMFHAFLDRLVERFTAVLAGVISSRVEGLKAQAQAEQQSQLEDLARKYEADGKTVIAQTLRQRTVNLTSSNLASEGVKVIELVANETPKLTNSEVAGQSNPGQNEQTGQFQALPDFSAPPNSRKKNRQNGGPDGAGPILPGAST